MLRIGTHKISGNPIYGPVYRFDPKFGGLHNVIKGRTYPPYYSAEWMEYMNENHKMTSNDIVVCSFWKSGTHWIKKILLELMRHNKRIKDHNRFKSINLVSEMPNMEFYGSLWGMDGYSDWINSTNDGYPRITHYHGSSDCFERIKHINNDATFIYIVRNPKDVCTSMHAFCKHMPDHEYSGDFNVSSQLFLQGMTQCSDWWEHVSEWNRIYQSKQYNLLWLYYEDMIDDTMNNIKTIAKHINMENDLDENDYNNIYEKILIENMKKEYTDNPGNMWEKVGVSPNAFFRSGNVGDWKQYFDNTMSHYFDTKTLIKFNQHANIKYYQQLIQPLTE